MPTMLKLYSNNQSNLVLCEAIEFACRQFYTIHRKPFMLQVSAVQFYYFVLELIFNTQLVIVTYVMFFRCLVELHQF